MAFKALRSTQNTMRQLLTHQPASFTGVSPLGCRGKWSLDGYWEEEGAGKDSSGKKKELTEKEKMWQEVEERHSKLEPIFDPNLNHWDMPIGSYTMPNANVFSHGFSWYNAIKKPKES